MPLPDRGNMPAAPPPIGAPSGPPGRAEGARRNDGAAARLPLQGRGGGARRREGRGGGWGQATGPAARTQNCSRRMPRGGRVGSATGARVLRRPPPCEQRGLRRRRPRTGRRGRASCACATAGRRRRPPCACASASRTPRCSLTPQGCRHRCHLTSRHSPQRLRRGAAAPAAAACCGAGAGPAGGAASQRGAALGGGRPWRRPRRRPGPHASAHTTRSALPAASVAARPLCLLPIPAIGAAPADEILRVDQRKQQLNQSTPWQGSP